MLVDWFVVDRFDLGVAMGFASSELEAGDLAACEIDFAADEPMGPSGIEREGVSQQRDGSLIVRATDEDHGALELAVSIEGPIVGVGSATRSILDAAGRALMHGLHKAIGLLLDISQRFEGEPSPDLLLPAAVVGFARGDGTESNSLTPAVPVGPFDPRTEINVVWLRSIILAPWKNTE